MHISQCAGQDYIKGSVKKQCVISQMVWLNQPISPIDLKMTIERTCYCVNGHNSSRLDSIYIPSDSEHTLLNQHVTVIKTSIRIVMRSILTKNRGGRSQISSNSTQGGTKYCAIE